ncbi:hypothetical protein ACVRZR_09775 [Streptococcus entericus]|uniref:hypothetical protein n=1 Tax=Streptococcus entericus TaxID=155680 RepID=UPI00039ABE6F|nr:hypothetical protein [Streptococcus entericus]
MKKSMTATELNEKLVVAEDALAELSKDDLVSLLGEIGYSPAAIDVLTEYQGFVKAFREKLGLL